MMISIKKNLVTGILVLTGGMLVAQPEGATEQNSQKEQHNLNTWSIGAQALHLFDLPAYRFDSDLNRDMRGLQGDNTKFDLGVNLYVEKQFTPLFGMQLGFRYGNMTGSNEVEYYENTFSEVYLDALFILTNLDGYFATSPWNIYAKGGAGYGGFQADQYLIFDDATDGSEKSNFWEVHGGAGVQYELSSNLRLELEVMLNMALTDGFDGYNSGSGSDPFLSTGLGIAYTLGNKEKKPMYAVGYFGDEYLNLDRAAKGPSRDKAPQQNKVKPEEIAQLKEQVAKLEQDLAALEAQKIVTPEKLKEATLEISKPQNNAASTMTSAYFEFDSSRLSSEAKMKISEALAGIDKKANHSITLVAYADKKGADAYNKQLKQRRAQSVKEFLMEMGFTASNITVEMGQANDYSSGNQFLNRKVMVKF